MKKTLKLFTRLFIMTVVFLGIKVSANAATFPNEITVTGFTWIGDYNAGRQYAMFTTNPSGGGHAYCLDADKDAPRPGGNTSKLSYFDIKKVFSQAQINKMIAVLRTSGDPNYSFGLGQTDSYYVTQFALWYAEYGEPVAGAGKGPFTAKTNSFFQNSSTYGAAYKKLIAAINEANKGTDYTKTNNSIAIQAASGTLTQDMEEKTVGNKKILLSKTLFKVSAPGNYNISVSGGYLTDQNGTKNNGTSANLKNGDSFKIAIEVPDNQSGNKSASFKVTTDKEYVTSYELAGYQKLNYSGLQRLVLLYENKQKLSANYSLKGNYEVKDTDIKIAKINKDKKLIAGATLGIYDQKTNSLIKSYTSKTDYITASLGEGSYYLQEVSAPEGYLLNDEKVKFSIDKDGKVKNGNGNVITNKTLTITDELPTIKIKKVNEKGVPVKNAKIVICNYDMNTKKESNCNFEWITDGNVKELTVGVDFGKIADASYIIKEVEAPHGFEISEPKYITVKDGKLYGDLQKDTVTIVDTSYLDVSKTDATGGQEIEGAKLQLYDNKGKLIEEWISEKKEHRIYGLNINEVYEIVETYAPEGYVPLQNSIKFRLTEEGKVETLNCNNTDSNNCSVMTTEEILKIKNDVTKIKISKIDVTNEQELPGARLQILNTDGSPVYQNGKVLEWTSTTEPHYIEMLPIGKYKLVETFSPEGYVAVSNEVEFEVKAETGVQTVVFENDVTKVLISKKDLTTGEEIPGATLQILNPDHTPVYQNGKKLEWVSTTEPYYIEKLPVGKYILVETIQPEGYQSGMIIDNVVTNEYEFEVKDNILLKIDVYNETIKTPNTSVNTTSTYVIGSMIIFAGIGTITISRKKNKQI